MSASITATGCFGKYRGLERERTYMKLQEATIQQLRKDSCRVDKLSRLMGVLTYNTNTINNQ